MPDKTGDIKIGDGSPVTNSTINTGTITNNYGAPKPVVVSTGDQDRARKILGSASERILVHCIGKGCTTSQSFLPAFAGTGWDVITFQTGTLMSMGGNGVDLGAGVHLMSKDADPNAVAALKKALDVATIKYTIADWTDQLVPGSFRARIADRRIMLYIGNPE